MKGPTIADMRTSILDAMGRPALAEVPNETPPIRRASDRLSSAVGPPPRPEAAVGKTSRQNSPRADVSLTTLEARGLNLNA